MQQKKPPLTSPVPKANGGLSLKGIRERQMRSIIKDLAHTGISTTVRKKVARSEASPKLLIKN